MGRTHSLMKRERGKLPAFLKRYFWDVSFTGLDLRRSSALLIERILEYGNPRAVRWLRGHVTPEAICDVVKRSRSLSARSANFWAMMYRLDRRTVRCLSTSSQRRRAQHWFV
ncbi:MAG: hypothetical protein HYY58_03355 [Candidatus Omnitrophica bacterium]|nr:hypothetical protein [Candidatus Omnitrophota bacterium]